MEDMDEEWGTMKFEDSFKLRQNEDLTPIEESKGQDKATPGPNQDGFSHDFNSPMDQLARRSFHGTFPAHDESEKTSHSGDRVVDETNMAVAVYEPPE